MCHSARRWALVLLMLFISPPVVNAGWPLHRARRQLAAAQQPVTAPTPQVDLGAIPRYPWGYFGAKPAPYQVYHRGYYGDYVDWSFRRGP